MKRASKKLAISADVTDHAHKVGCGYRDSYLWARKKGLPDHSEKYPRAIGQLCADCPILTCGRNDKGGAQ